MLRAAFGRADRSRLKFKTARRFNLKSNRLIKDSFRFVQDILPAGVQPVNLLSQI